MHIPDKQEVASEFWWAIYFAVRCFFEWCVLFPGYLCYLNAELCWWGSKRDWAFTVKCVKLTKSKKMRPCGALIETRIPPMRMVFNQQWAWEERLTFKTCTSSTRQLNQLCFFFTSKAKAADGKGLFSDGGWRLRRTSRKLILLLSNVCYLLMQSGIVNGIMCYPNLFLIDIRIFHQYISEGGTLFTGCYFRRGI